MLLVAGALFAFGGVMAEAQATVVPFATGEWAPYSSERLPGQGAAVEIVNAACAAAGLRPTYQFVPWKRAEQQVVDGNVFAAFPYFVIPERVARPDLYAHSDALFPAVFRVLYDKRNPATPGPVPFARTEDLRGYTVGVLAGSPLITTPLEKAGVAYEETTNLADSVRKLAMGRVDFVIDDDAVAWAAVKEAFPDRLNDFAFLPRPFTPVLTAHLLVSRRFPESASLLARFNDGLKKIRSSGALQKIYDRWGIS